MEGRRDPWLQTLLPSDPDYCVSFDSLQHISRDFELYTHKASSHPLKALIAPPALRVQGKHDCLMSYCNI